MRIFSTLSSIKNREISFLAVLETILSIIVYWWIAWAFDAHIHLLISLSVAPFLLLRSDESVVFGVNNFLKFIERNLLDVYQFHCGRDFTFIWKIGIYAASLQIFVTYIAKKYAVFDDYLLYDKIFLFIFFYSILSVSFVTAIWGILNGICYSVVMFFVVSFFVIAFCVQAIFGFFFSGLMAVVLSMLTVWALGKAVIFLMNKRWVVTFSVSVFLYLIPTIFGFWLRTIFIRIYSTLRFLSCGIEKFPQNWWCLVLSIDSRHAPEVVPGLGERFEFFTFKSMYHSIQRENKIFAKLFLLVAAVIFYTPAFFYRWSIKSTCWLYLPLLYLCWPDASVCEDRRVSISLIYSGVNEWVRRLVSLIVVASAVFSSFNLSWLVRISENFPHAPMLLSLFALDITKLTPWQCGGGVSAILTFFLWIRAQRVERYYRFGYAPKSSNIATILYVVRLRSIVSFFTVLIAFGFVFLALEGINPRQLPNWLSFLAILYGPYL